jgi:hypothetical protein
MTPRNLFKTKTVIAAIVTAIGSIMFAITPIVKNYLIRHTPDLETKQDIEDATQALSIALGVLGFGSSTIAIRGRYEATPDVYTPDLMGGRNKADIPTEVASEISKDHLDFGKKY